MHFVLPSLQIVLASRQQKQLDENQLELLLNAHDPLLIDEIAQPKQNCARLSTCEVAIRTPS